MRILARKRPSDSDPIEPDIKSDEKKEVEFQVQLSTLQKCFGHLSKSVLINALEGESIRPSLKAISPKPLT